MNKIAYLFVICMLTVTFQSCKKDDSSNDNNNNPLENLISRVTHDVGNYVEFEYDEQRRLTKTTKVEAGVTTEVVYAYDGAGNVTSKTTTQLGVNPFTRVDSFTYNSANQLTLASFQNGTTLSYVFAGDNTYTVTNSNTLEEETVKLNASGQIIEITDSSGYSNTFSYDSNGNLITEQFRDTDGSVLDTTTYGYDNRQSPFHGQLEYLYIYLFMRVDGTLPFLDLDPFEFLRYSNNIKSVTFTDGTTFNYEFTYGDNGLPESYSNPHSAVYEVLTFEYY